MADTSIPDEQKRFFMQALQTLHGDGVPFLVGGGHAVNWYTGSHRNTKDLDLIVTPPNYRRALGALAKNGIETTVKDALWLAKAIARPYFIDLIWGTGNWISSIDEQWFANAREGKLFGEPVAFAPPEELIWVKAFIASRDRFDGSDVNHLILALRGDIDWRRLLDRFGRNWEVLLVQLILFRFVYPSKREYIPKWLVDDLLTRYLKEVVTPYDGDNLSRGSFFDIIGSYDIDLEQFGFIDGRRELCPRHQRSRPAPDEVEDLRCERLLAENATRRQLLEREAKRAKPATRRRHRAA